MTVTNLHPMVKEFWKSISILWSHGHLTDPQWPINQFSVVRMYINVDRASHDRRRCGENWLSYCMKKSGWEESGGVSFSNRFASSCMLCFILRISADSLWLYKHTRSFLFRCSPETQVFHQTSVVREPFAMLWARKGWTQLSQHTDVGWMADSINSHCL